MKMTRKQIANQIFDLYKASRASWKDANKAAWVRHLLTNDLGTGYKSLEELTAWRDRLAAEIA